MRDRKHWFSLQVPDEILRKMTRKQYYEVQSYLRLVRRKVASELKGDNDAD